MDITQFMKKITSDSRSIENNWDKSFQKWVLFNQHRLMREPQTQLSITQVHFSLSCVELTMITTFIRQFSKSCNVWQKEHVCGKLVYSST